MFDERSDKEQEITFENVEALHSMNEEQIHFDNEKNQEQKQQQTHPISTRQHIHLHDTASGLDVNDDKIKTNQETNKTFSVCQDGHLSSFAYFSQVRNKLIECDDFSNEKIKDKSKN